MVVLAIVAHLIAAIVPELLISGVAVAVGYAAWRVGQRRRW